MDTEKLPANLVFLDLETLPEDATVNMDPTRPPGWMPSPVSVERKNVPRSYKKEETILKWQVEEEKRYLQAEEDARVKQQADALEEWRNRSKSPIKGRIACISLAFGEGEVEVISCPEDEAAGLRRLGDLLMDHEDALKIGAEPWDDNTQLVIVSFNGSGFDWPFLWKRLVKHRGPNLARRFRQPKPWSGKLVDPMKLWDDGYRAYISLDAMCEFLGIKRAPSEIDGSGVLNAYVEGNFDKVTEHADADIIDMRECYRRIIEAI